MYDSVADNVIQRNPTFSRVRRFFNPAHKARREGYFPKSHWTKQNQEVVDVGQPTLAVAKCWTTFTPVDGDIYLAFSEQNEYLVTNTKYDPEIGSCGCWEVYCEEETQPKNNTTSNKRNQEQLEQTSPLLPLSLPLSLPHPPSPNDGETIVNSDPKSNKIPVVTSNATTYTLNKKSREKGDGQWDITVYFPENFNWSNYHELGPYRSSFMWWTHKLHERRFVNIDRVIYGKEDFIPIKTTYARALDPDFRHLVKLLLDKGIWERDFYEEGSKSYGYRFTDPNLKHATRRRVPLDDPKLAKRIDRHRKKQATTRVDRWLKSQLYQLGLGEIDEGFLTTVGKTSVKENGGTLEDKLEAYRYVLERISEGEHSWQPDDQGRRYSLITNMKRELRSLLRVENMELQQIDIANSQLTFLALEMRREGVECPVYFELCEQGQLYEHVAHHAQTTRRNVKKAITQRALFSENDAACQRSKIMRTFDRLFPEVANYLHRAKDCHDGGSRLAKQLQFAEADLIIDRVCGRLRREDKTQFVTPIHDSLVFLPDDSEYIKAVMAEEFEKLGICPTLEVEAL